MSIAIPPKPRSLCRILSLPQSVSSKAICIEGTEPSGVAGSRSAACFVMRGIPCRVLSRRPFSDD